VVFIHFILRGKRGQETNTSMSQCYWERYSAERNDDSNVHVPHNRSWDRYDSSGKKKMSVRSSKSCGGTSGSQETSPNTHTHRHTRTWTHKHTRRCTRGHTDTWTHKHTHRHTRRHIDTHAHMDTQAHTQTHTWTHRHTGAHTHTYTWTHKHTRRHTHTRTHTHSNFLGK
jgi:hypothetical protein